MDHFKNVLGELEKVVELEKVLGELEKGTSPRKLLSSQLISLFQVGLR